jgi:2-(1,2-epoxy-1,2-dihydrophenyl)acetyl-CoA isomerase
MTKDDDGLQVHHTGGILRLTIDRPESGNSFTGRMQEALLSHFAEANADSDVRVVVLGAAGDRHFCTGPDLRDDAFLPAPERTIGGAARQLRVGSQSVISSILDCEKPVICCLNGTAAGGGANLALACDLIIAAESASMVELFVRRGLAPDGGAAYLLSRRLPLNVVKQLLFFGDPLSATDAFRLGLVNAVVPPEKLAEETTAWAIRLAEGPTLAISAAKTMLNQASDVDRNTAFATEALLVELVTGSADVAEGVDSFLSRRDPVFRGR